MRRARFPVMVVLAWSLPLVAWAQLTDAQVLSAIEFGLTAKVPVTYVEVDTKWFEISLRGPLSQIAAAAQNASKKRKPFTLASVTEKMREAAVRIQAAPKVLYDRNPEHNLQGASPASNLVILPSGEDQPVSVAIRPTSVNTFSFESVDVSSLRRFKSKGVDAVFDLAKLPPGEFVVVVFTENGEERATVKTEDRAKIW